MDQSVTYSAFAAALLDPARPVPAGITTHRGDVDPARFDVYRNNVFVGLVRALEKVFPVTRRLVGEEFFAGMARAYAGNVRPSSPLLFEYGDAFADFISGFGPARGLAYLPDVARLEFAWLGAYHARDAIPLRMTDLAVVPVHRLGGLRLASHPAARLVCSRHPVGAIWAAHQGDSVGKVDQWSPQTVLVARPALDVAVHVLPSADVAFAAALLSGATLEGAAAEALAANPDFDFGTALVGLTALGAFETVLED